MTTVVRTRTYGDLVSVWGLHQPRRCHGRCLPGQAVTSIGRPATDAIARQGPPRLLTMHLLSTKKRVRVRVSQFNQAVR